MAGAAAMSENRFSSQFRTRNRDEHPDPQPVPDRPAHPPPASWSNAPPRCRRRTAVAVDTALVAGDRRDVRRLAHVARTEAVPGRCSVVRDQRHVLGGGAQASRRNSTAHAIRAAPFASNCSSPWCWRRRTRSTMARPRARCRRSYRCARTAHQRGTARPRRTGQARWSAARRSASLAPAFATQSDEGRFAVALSVAEGFDRGNSIIPAGRRLRRSRPVSQSTRRRRARCGRWPRDPFDGPSQPSHGWSMNCDRIASISRMSRSIPRRPGSCPSDFRANCTRVNGVAGRARSPASIRLRSAAALCTSPLARISTVEDVRSRTSRRAHRTRRGRSSSPRTRLRGASGQRQPAVAPGTAGRSTPPPATPEAHSRPAAVTENCRAPTRAPGRRPPTTAAGYRASSHSARLANCVRRSLRGRRHAAARPSISGTMANTRPVHRRPAVRCGLRGRCCATVPACVRGGWPIERSTDSAKASRLCSNCTVGGQVVSSRPAAPQGGGAGQHQHDHQRQLREHAAGRRDSCSSRAGRRRSPRPNASAAHARLLGDPPRAAAGRDGDVDASAFQRLVPLIAGQAHQPVASTAGARNQQDREFAAGDAQGFAVAAQLAAAEVERERPEAPSPPSASARQRQYCRGAGSRGSAPAVPAGLTRPVQVVVGADFQPDDAGRSRRPWR